MKKTRILIFLLTIIVVGTIGYLATLYAKGYRFDPSTLHFVPNGLLVIKSNPDGAQIYINGELKTATNATISLTPGTYDVSVRKDGYMSWQKRLTIEKEIVTDADAQLFKAVPSLSAITFSGVLNPVPSPDFTKLAYIVPIDNVENGSKAGLWVMETVNLPLGFTRDPRRITDGDLSNATFTWSPDGREILLTTKSGVYQLDAGTFTAQGQRVNVASKKTDILAKWQTEAKQKLDSQIKSLPSPLDDILSRKAKDIEFSPDETKILYTASGSATIPDNLIKPVPGASTQKQDRDLKDGNTYVYDTKEDRNFLVDTNGSNLTIHNQLGDGVNRRLSWFATSRQLVLSEDSKITILDFDGTNRQIVYSGSYVSPQAFSTVNTDRLLILTNLGSNSAANLYSLSLR